MLRAVAVALAATSFALAASPAPSPFDNPAFVRSAIVMRHCVRSTNLVLANGSLPTKPDAPAPMDEFANSSFPSWPPDSLPKLCLDEGIVRIADQSARLKVSPTLAPRGTVRVWADSAPRDATTAKALLGGLGLDPTDFETQPLVFDPVISHSHEGGLCKKIKDGTAAALVNARLAAALNRTGALLAQGNCKRGLQAVLGGGSAPPLQDIAGSVTEKGVLVGGPYIASEITSTFMMQLGSDSPSTVPAWGRFGGNRSAQLLSYLQLHYFGRSVQYRDETIAARYGSNLLAHVLLFLRGDNSTGAAGKNETAFFVGHDGNMDDLAAMLGLQWDAAPYGSCTADCCLDRAGSEWSPTPPGSMLRFDVAPSLTEKGATVVRATFVYTSVAGQNGELLVSPVNFGSQAAAPKTPQNEMPFAQFEVLGNASLVQECISLQL